MQTERDEESSDPGITKAGEKQFKLMQSGSNVVLHYTDVSGKSQAEVFCMSVLIHSSLVHFLAFSKLCRRVELGTELRVRGYIISILL